MFHPNRSETDISDQIDYTSNNESGDVYITRKADIMHMYFELLTLHNNTGVPALLNIY